MRPRAAAHAHQGTVGITEGIVQQKRRARQSGGKKKRRDAKYNFFHNGYEQTAQPIQSARSRLKSHAGQNCKCLTLPVMGRLRIFLLGQKFRARPQHLVRHKIRPRSPPFKPPDSAHGLLPIGREGKSAVAAPSLESADPVCSAAVPRLRFFFRARANQIFRSRKNSPLTGDG